MQITVMGAARTVTGSSYLVEMDDGVKFLVDCGLFQGGQAMEMRNWQQKSYNVADLSAIFITHAHIDHSGLAPRLVRQGYGGPIYATEATCELLKILWLDSAHIQELEAQWQTRKNKRGGKRVVEPLYETEDAEQAGALLKPVEMNTNLNLMPNVVTSFVSAGHILGASSILLTLHGNDGVHRVAFSGDIGRPGQLIVPDPERFPRPDTLFMETTYGARLHKSLVESQEELITVINQAYKEGGKVLIPAFAVERTQELIYTMAKAWREGRFPKDMPVFLDSPLAIRATEIFRAHPEFFDDETREMKEAGGTPLNFPNLKFTLSTEDSRAINEYQGSAVIMAGNGMASAGRIKHHLKHNIWRDDCHVVIVGFQAQGTTGRRLVEGAKLVRIFREEVAVHAKVHTIGGFSAHADQGELMRWLAPLAHKDLTVCLVHGEESGSLVFRDLAKKSHPEVIFRVPRFGDTLELSGREGAKSRRLPRQARPDASRLADHLAVLLEKVAAGELPPEKTAALEQALARLEDVLDE